MVGGKTRSGKEYTPYQVTVPTFQLRNLMEQAIHEEERFGYLDFGIDPEMDYSVDHSQLSLTACSPPEPSTSQPVLPATTSSPSPQCFQLVADKSSPRCALLDANTPGAEPLCTTTPCSDNSGSDMSISSDDDKAQPKRHAAQKRKSHRRRKGTRFAQKIQAEANNELASVRPKAAKKHRTMANSIPTNLDQSKLQIASSGFIGLRDKIGSERYQLEEFVGKDSVHNFTLIEWDGRKRRPLVDQNGIVFAVLAGHPDDSCNLPGNKWLDQIKNIVDIIESVRPKCKFDSGSQTRRRGNFGALSFGISYGGGQTHPRNLSEDEAHQDILQSFVQHPSFIRVSKFANSAFKTWAPKLHHHYATTLSNLQKRHPDLRRHLPHSVWAAFTINFGPAVCCVKHRDFGNFPGGWCAVTCGGSFNPKLGGHLVLWECKLVIEFPPGSTILLPSAVISHSNLPIQPQETRYSWTQFSAGGLFRWAAHGFQAEGEYEKGRSAAELAQEKAEQVKHALCFWSSHEDLMSID